MPRSYWQYPSAFREQFVELVRAGARMSLPTSSSLALRLPTIG
jgi:hypothetical protein